MSGPEALENDDPMAFTKNYLAFQRCYQPVKIGGLETPTEPVQFTNFKSATLRHLRKDPRQPILTVGISYLRADPLYGTLCFYATHRGGAFNARDKSHLHRLAIQRYLSLARAVDPEQLIREAFAARDESMLSHWKRMHWPYPLINIAESPRRLTP